MTRIVWVVISLLATAAANGGALVIAHRGASAYLPEHTLPAVAMAHAMGADYIEQDVVLTKDDKLVVLHDTTLNRTTDVARVFPGRAREDGRFYAIDFSLAEIKKLKVNERRDEAGQAVFNARFPSEIELLRVPTLAEEVELIRGMNRSTGRNVGIYVELKDPGFHAQEGRDLPGIVLRELHKFGYQDADDRAYLQCFDAGTLKNLRLRTSVRLVQLLSSDDLVVASAAEISDYADAVGLSIEYLAAAREFVAAAKNAGLKVHPYTFRADQLPPYVDSFDSLLELFVEDMNVDGVFTDHADLARKFIDGRRNR